MRSVSLAQILIFLISCYFFFVLIRNHSIPRVHSAEKRWVIHNGYCIRPYLHAGTAVAIRLLSDPMDKKDIILKEFPKDDPRKFQDDLTLLAHSSASALDEEYLSNLISNWRGPISLAVSLQGEFNEDFVRSKIERTLRWLSHPEDASRLAVHVMFQRSGELSCDESEMHLNDKKEDKKGVFFADYPINTVRNVARLFTSTRYIAFADSDYLFSAGFYRKMLAILRENVLLGSKNALLYRIFEVEKKDSQRRNNQLTKAHLKELIEHKRARVFHVKRWPAGHSVPLLPEWLEAPETEQPGLFNLTISLKKREVWEFQFAGLRDVPLFDENFPYRADNNLELRWEVCRAGYRLLPVEDLFVYHTLSHERHNKDDAQKKYAIKKKNMARFVKAKRALVKRMRKQYPGTRSECPV